MQRMRLSILASLVLTQTACPADDGTDNPFNTTTTQNGDGDGDGDGDETTTGDGDGDGDGDESCGDGVVQPDEQCDLGPENAEDGQCTPICTIADCGDGYHYAQYEECDDGNAENTDACVSGCKLASCGDGFAQAGVEACDDGNDNEADGCTSMCLPATCGDAVVQEGEQCDDGNADTTDSCPACQLAFCGDGFMQAGVEQCDDGNDVDTDACPTSCQMATCGDGFVLEGEEECDDGNNVDDDGCANDCTANNCLQDWMVGVLPCNPMFGACQDSETGYHWKGLYLYNNLQYACWWHTKNQGWNTTTTTNFWHLADAFLLNKNVGTSRWCYPFAADPCQSGACAQGPDPAGYFDSTNVGAWGWCGGGPWESGGFVCIPAPMGVACE